MTEFTCYISMPTGLKQLRSGDVVDYDGIYRDQIMPAVEQAGLRALRSDELVAQGLIHAEIIFEAVIKSLFMVADLTEANPNVLYELGLRHALRSDRTIIITSDLDQIPFDLSGFRVLRYDTRSSPEGVSRFTAELGRNLSELRSDSIVTSPLHSLFSTIDVQLPSSLSVELSAAPSEALSDRIASALRVDESRARLALLRALDQELRDDGVSTSLIEEVVTAYLDAGAWDDAIELVRGSGRLQGGGPQLATSYAIALIRRDSPGDLDDAIDLLRDAVAHSGSASAIALLGKALGERYLATGEVQDLEDAIDLVAHGFRLHENDLQIGLRLAALLRLRPTSRDDVADEVRPLLRTLARNAASTATRQDYWTNASAFELAVWSEDWETAEQLSHELLSAASSPWMLESLASSLQNLANGLSDPVAQEHVSRLLERLTANG